MAPLLSCDLTHTIGAELMFAISTWYTHTEERKSCMVGKAKCILM